MDMKYLLGVGYEGDEIFKVNDGKLVLPDFRDFEWKEPDQRRLLSLFCSPIGSLCYYMEGKTICSKETCFPQNKLTEEDCLYLLIINSFKSKGIFRFLSNRKHGKCLG